jgi:hypothetical protein
LVESFCWSLPVEGLSWAAIELDSDGVEVFLGVAAERCALREVLA